MIQDIAPHKMDNQFRQGMRPDALSPVLMFTGKRMEHILVHISQGHISFPTMAEMPERLTYTYLFTMDDRAFFMALEEEPDPSEISQDLVAVDSRALRPEYYLGDENRHLIFAAYTAGQLARWYHDNRYCGSPHSSGGDHRRD